MKKAITLLMIFLISVSFVSCAKPEPDKYKIKITKDELIEGLSAYLSEGDSIKPDLDIESNNENERIGSYIYIMDIGDEVMDYKLYFFLYITYEEETGLVRDISISHDPTNISEGPFCNAIFSQVVHILDESIDTAQLIKDLQASAEEDSFMGICVVNNLVFWQVNSDSMIDRYVRVYDNEETIKTLEKE